MTEGIIHVEGLSKTFRQGLFKRKVQAVRAISFDVPRGSIFGFLGPNGAGKTTTLKMLTGLIFPTTGQARVLGFAVPDRRARARLGFLGENPYVYPYLTPREFVQMCAQLCGIPTKMVKERSLAVLRRTGVEYAADRPVRRLSKGMLQRVALAAALVGEPELLILDEPMSGLDPVGRKEVRDLILDEKQGGRTVLFSSHILSDVESLCDAVAIMRQGEIVVSGRIDQLVRHEGTATEIVLADDPNLPESLLDGLEVTVQRAGGRLVLRVEGVERVQKLIALAVQQDWSILEVTPRQETLQDIFLRHEIGSPSA